MRPRIILTLLLSVLGLFAAGAPAFAAPGDYGPITVVSSVSQVDAGGSVTIGGTGFTPGETIDIEVTYQAPSGLRANAALRLALAAAVTQTAKADASGDFSASVKPTQVGTATITAIGRSSGNRVSTTVTVLPAGTTTTTGTTTAAGSTTTAAGAAAAPTDGLAYTGASIAGPLTLGVSVLIVGVALVIFGARLVRRRKHVTSTH